MRFFPVLVIVLSSLVFSCRTASSFESPNSFRNIQSILYLKNGDSISGYLTIDINNSIGRPIKIYPIDEKKALKFSKRDVMGYKTNRELYVLKTVKNNSITIGNGKSLLEQLVDDKDMYFMKQLTPESSRIHFYESERIEKVKENNQTYNGRSVTEYYVQLPHTTGNLVYALDNKLFVPNFEEKMSDLVKDCPELAKKIAAKEKGYFYAQINLLKEKRAAIMMNIIEEYNNCR